MPGRQPPTVRLPRGDRRVHARGPDRAPQRNRRGGPERRGSPAGHDGAARVTAQAMPGQGSNGSTGASVPNATTAPLATRAAIGKRAGLGALAPERRGPGRRRSAGGPAASRRRCRAPRSGATSSGWTSWACSTRGHEPGRPDGGRQHVERGPHGGIPDAVDLGRDAQRRRPRRLLGQARRRRQPDAQAVVGGRRLARRLVHRLEERGGPGPERSVGEGLEPAEAQPVQRVRAERLAAPDPGDARRVQLLRPDAGMQAHAELARGGELAVGVERPAEVMARRQAARVVDGDDAGGDELPREQRATASAMTAGRGGGTSEDPRRVADSCSTPVGRPSRSRRITPPGGSAAPSSIPASAIAAWLASSAWWSWAQRATRRPGAASSRSAAVGQRPSRSGSHPPPSIHSSSTRQSPRPARARSARRSTRQPSSATCVAASAASARWRCASVRPGTATSSSARTIRRVPGPATPSTSASDPAATTRPRAIAIASTHPGPSSPARVAILPTTTRSARWVIPRPGVPAGPRRRR